MDPSGRPARARAPPPGARPLFTEEEDDDPLLAKLNAGPFTILDDGKLAKVRTCMFKIRTAGGEVISVFEDTVNQSIYLDDAMARWEAKKGSKAKRAAGPDGREVGSRLGLVGRDGRGRVDAHGRVAASREAGTFGLLGLRRACRGVWRVPPLGSKPGPSSAFLPPS